MSRLQHEMSSRFRFRKERTSGLSDSARAGSCRRRNAARHAPDAPGEEKQEKGEEKAEKPDNGKFKVVPERNTLLRLVRGLPSGVAESVFDIEGCTSSPKMKWLSVAVVDFRKDGIPRHVVIRTEPEGGSCRRTAETLFLMSLAPQSIPDPSTEPMPYLAVFVANALSCEEAPPARPSDTASADLVRVRGKVQAPKRTKLVQPVYPPESRRKGEHGVSTYEGVITTSGCVTDLRLLQSSEPILDVMGMEASRSGVTSPRRSMAGPCACS